MNRLLAFVYGVAAVLALTGDEAAWDCACALVVICFLPSLVAACAAMLRTVAARPGLNRRLYMPDSWRGRCALVLATAGCLVCFPAAPFGIPAVVTLAYAHHLPVGRRWREVALGLAPCATIVAGWFAAGDPPFPFIVLGVSLLAAAAMQLWPARGGAIVLGGL